MNKWEKILRDTDSSSSLNHTQRLWRCIALLRLKKLEQAEILYQEANEEFKEKINSQLVYAEILLSSKNNKACNTLLEQLYIKCIKNKDQQQWLFIAKRLKAPSEFIQNKLREETIDHTTHKSTDLKKILLLDDFKNDFILHLKYLESLVSEEYEELDIIQACKNLVSKFKLSAYQYHQIEKVIINKVDWSFLISFLFPHINAVHRERKLLWRQWRKNCPPSHYNLLTAEFNKFLTKKPDLELENL